VKGGVSAKQTDYYAVLSAYKQGLAECDAEIEMAQKYKDHAAEKDWREKKKGVLAELRKMKSDPRLKRLMDTVRKRIGDALSSIREVNPSLAGYLDDTIRKGWQCKYQDPGNPPVDWDL